MMIPIFHTKTCAVHYQNDYVHVIKMLQNRKLDSGALTTLFLSRFETGVTETESHLQKELTHSNQLYYSLTYSNEILNAHVCYLEHKLHIVHFLSTSCIKQFFHCRQPLEQKYFYSCLL